MLELPVYARVSSPNCFRTEQVVVQYNESDVSRRGSRQSLLMIPVLVCGAVTVPVRFGVYVARASAAAWATNMFLSESLYKRVYLP